MSAGVSRESLVALLVVLVLLALAGCASSLPRESPQMQAARRVIVLEALGQIGRPYRYGGTTPEGFDCSGLTQYVYRQAGIAIPRSTREQHAAGQPIELKQAQPGDLLFYRFGKGRKIDHVAVFLGDGQAVHAPASRRNVIVAQVSDPAWMQRYVDAVRLIGN